MVGLRDLTKVERWAELRVLQKEYPDFRDFMYDVMTTVMGFQCTDNQLDMALYLETGPLYRMIQAQRGQAKTTVTAIYAVWRAIQNPKTRVFIVSASDKRAKEISNWIIQIMSNMEELSCMLPDRAHGDRASVEAYDIHYTLKGPEKSPSFACMGITGNLAGARADVLIADDVESQKNSLTAEMREKLTHLTREFTSICSTGDIIYLGTPQSVDSIYNGLPSRGFDVRIWPGRYPTEEEIDNYGTFLAPMLQGALEADPALRYGGGLDGTRGQPTDAIICSEEVLNKKELDQGPAHFQLQFMLDTRLSDAERYPLKLAKVIFMQVPPTSVPTHIYHQASDATVISNPSDYPLHDRMYKASSFSQEFGAFQGTHMYVDPAGGGQNGDETAYAVTRFSSGKVYLVDIGGVPGGLGTPALDALTAIAKKWQPNQIDIEKNYGNGALSSVWQPTLFKACTTSVEDVWETGQKELRIIDTLEPVIGSGRLIVDTDLIIKDWNSVRHHPAERRASYSLFVQLAKITRDRGSLFHDDRLDALAGSVRHWVSSLKQDEDHARYVAQKKAYSDMMKDPLGNGQPIKGYSSMTKGFNRPNALASLRRRY